MGGPSFSGLPGGLATKITLSQRQLSEVAVLPSVTSLVDISVDNISLDTLPENRITSASAAQELHVL